MVILIFGTLPPPLKPFFHLYSFLLSLSPPLPSPLLLLLLSSMHLSSSSTRGETKPVGCEPSSCSDLSVLREDDPPPPQERNEWMVKHNKRIKDDFILFHSPPWIDQRQQHRGGGGAHCEKEPGHSCALFSSSLSSSSSSLEGRQSTAASARSTFLSRSRRSAGRRRKRKRNKKMKKQHVSPKTTKRHHLGAAEQDQDSLEHIEKRRTKTGARANASNGGASGRCSESSSCDHSVSRHCGKDSDPVVRSLHAAVRQLHNLTGVTQEKEKRRTRRMVDIRDELGLFQEECRRLHRRNIVQRIFQEERPKAMVKDSEALRRRLSIEAQRYTAQVSAVSVLLYSLRQGLQQTEEQHFRSVLEDNHRLHCEARNMTSAMTMRAALPLRLLTPPPPSSFPLSHGLYSRSTPPRQRVHPHPPHDLPPPPLSMAQENGGTALPLGDLCYALERMNGVRGGENGGCWCVEEEVNIPSMGVFPAPGDMFGGGEYGHGVFHEKDCDLLPAVAAAIEVDEGWTSSLAAARPEHNEMTMSVTTRRRRKTPMEVKYRCLKQEHDKENKGRQSKPKKISNSHSHLHRHHHHHHHDQHRHCYEDSHPRADNCEKEEKKQEEEKKRRKHSPIILDHDEKRTLLDAAWKQHVRPVKVENSPSVSENKSRETRNMKKCCSPPVDINTRISNMQRLVNEMLAKQRALLEREKVEEEKGGARGRGRDWEKNRRPPPSSSVSSSSSSSSPSSPSCSSSFSSFSSFKGNESASASNRVLPLITTGGIGKEWRGVDGGDHSKQHGRHRKEKMKEEEEGNQRKENGEGNDDHYYPPQSAAGLPSFPSSFYISPPPPSSSSSLIVPRSDSGFPFCSSSLSSSLSSASRRHHHLPSLDTPSSSPPSPPLKSASLSLSSPSPSVTPSASASSLFSRPRLRTASFSSPSVSDDGDSRRRRGEGMC